jgi:hypothetical protein
LRRSTTEARVRAFFPSLQTHQESAESMRHNARVTPADSVTAGLLGSDPIVGSIGLAVGSIPVRLTTFLSAPSVGSK